MKETVRRYYLLFFPLLILAGVSFWHYFNLFSGRVCYFLRYFPGCDIRIIDPFLLIFCLAAIFFSLIIFYRRQFYNYLSGKNIDNKHLIVIIVMALSLAFLINQFVSGDLEYYFNVGRAVSRGINPYVQDWQGGNQFYSDSDQIMSAGVMYGPLSLRFFSWIYALSFGSIYFFILIVKILCLLSLVLAGYVMLLLARHLGHKRKDFLAVWFLSPLVLIEWLSNGHFDGFWLVLVLFSYFLAIKKKWWLSFPMLTLAVWLKFVPALFGPVLLVWWWQDFNFKSFKAIKEAVIATALSLGITFISWWGLWTGIQSLQGIILQSKWAAHSIFYVLYYGIAGIIGSYAEAKYHYLLSGGLQLILLFFAFWLIYPFLIKVIEVLLRRRKMETIEYFHLTFICLAVFIFVIQKSIWPWYVIWLLPFGLLCNVYFDSKLLNKILSWLGAGPLLFYCLWFFGDSMLGNYWFFTYAMFVISAGPIFLLIKLRKDNYA